MKRYADRAEAGRELARELARFAGRDDLIVLGLPRGGVPVAAEVAAELGAPLDVFVVRKLGVPGHEELAMGAIGPGGTQVVNTEVRDHLAIADEELDRVAAAERVELVRRESTYRGDRPFPDLTDRLVILVDDGLATGASMRAAVQAVQVQQPARIVVAVPVAPPDTCESLARLGIEVICPYRPARFGGVGRFYLDFSQTTDREVREVMERTRH
jgi:predicted phosphoribosyltransferase